MRTELLFSLCTVILLVQNINAYPADFSTSDEIKEENSRDQLISDINENGVNMTNWLVNEVKTIFQKVLQEVEKKHEHDLTEYVNELESFIDRANKLPEKVDEEEHFTELTALYAFVDSLMAKYVVNEINNNNLSFKEISTILKHEHNKIKPELTSGVLSFIARKAQLVKSYIDSLTPSEKGENSDLVEWYQKMQQEGDIEKKIYLNEMLSGSVLKQKH